MTDIVVIGGSAGSLPIVAQILDALPEDFNYSVVLVVHRLKTGVSELVKTIGINRSKLHIKEPDDKELMKHNHIYLAPQNYHLLIEEDRSFSLDYSELVNYSRPSIDVTFECVASVFGDKAVGILLSGANYDGAEGLSKIIKAGGIGIVQTPETAEYPNMPLAAIAKNSNNIVRSPEEIVQFIKTLNL
jgi:two-component system, chemotaxis family, protein-glutamate methylesterase/glutaminase